MYHEDSRPTFIMIDGHQVQCATPFTVGEQIGKWAVQWSAIAVGLLGVSWLAVVLGVRFEGAALIVIAATAAAIFIIFMCATSEQSLNWIVAATYPYVLSLLFLRSPCRQKKKNFHA